MRASDPPARSSRRRAGLPFESSEGGRSPRRAACLSRACALSLALAWTTPLEAQTQRADPGWLRQWTDVRGDLQSSDPSTRLRAIERLGASPEARSRHALVDAVRDATSEAPASAPQGRGANRDASGDAASETAELNPSERARIRLALARALAQHSDHLEVRRALVRLMTAAADGLEPHDDMALHTAALALALSGAPDALRALGRALWQGESLARASHRALLGHPPAQIEPVLRTAPADAALALLAELGDQRADEHLREVVRNGPPAQAAAAAWALFRLGTLETQEVARHWWKHSADASQRFVATRILVEAGDPLGTQALSAQLTELPQDPRRRRTLLELAAAQPDAGWEAGLLRLARAALASSAPRRPTAEDELVFLALAKLDRSPSLRLLLRGLDGPAAPVVAGALARADGPQGSALLAQTLDEPSRRRWALRILGVRLARGSADAQRGPFEAATTKLLQQSKGAGANADADRAAAAWAIAVAQPERAAELLSTADPVVLRALGRQSWREPLAAAATARLTRTSPPSPQRQRGAKGSGENETADGAEESALLSALLAPEAAARVPTQRLEALLSPPARVSTREGPATLVELLVARVPARGDEGEEPLHRVRRWLGSPHVATRIAAARGLAAANTPGAIALLGDTLAWDPEPAVRRAAAWALVQRPEPSGRRWLEVAARLDPDPVVRDLARLRSSASPGTPRTRTRDALLWLHGEEGPVQLFTASGETLWLFPDPDGFVGVHGPLAKPWDLRRLPVANPAARGEAPPVP